MEKTVSGYIDDLHAEITPIISGLTEHILYQKLRSLGDLHIFMRYHVYAVWDFMSLLKSLQQGLTCTKVPWFPVGSGATRALINEIVCGEESDVALDGSQKSHFEMYLDAMEQCGADTSEITNFINALKSGRSLADAFNIAGTPPAARRFVTHTFSVIDSGQLHVQAAAFTFGREDVIPKIFYQLVDELNKELPQKLDIFTYYLNRHIELDGDHHSHLAVAMTNELCGVDLIKWQQAKKAAANALTERGRLWDGIVEEILQ